jgi:uncharacterized protein YigE (DUF2233 family)
MTRLHRSWIFVLLFLPLPACAGDWRRVSPGVEYQHITRGPLDVHVARIDLRNRNVRVVATRESERGLTVTEYARRAKAIIAINADYFTEKIEPMGVALGACGRWWNGVPLGRKQGLVAFGIRRAEIQRNTMETRPWMKGAVSGWPQLVQGCKVIEDLPGSDHFTRAPHPRTAVGLSRNGKTAYFVVADGRREGIPGPTLPELATFLREELGVCEAMNLDGGGSSAMWVRDAIVNQPSDGKERNVGNHLAVVAARDAECPAVERKAKE